MNILKTTLTGAIALSLLLPACTQDPATPKTSSTTKESAQQTSQPTQKKLPQKLVFAFQKQKDPKKIAQTAKKVSEILSTRIGVPVEVMIPSSYGSSVQALVSNKAQVAYLSSIPFILAKNEAPVQPLLVEERSDKTFYNSVFVVSKDSPFQSLDDLKGKRMMFTSPTSTSGYVMAYSRLVDDGHLQPKQNPAEYFGDVNFAGGYDRALLSVLNGQADVCAVSDYTMEGPKADIYLTPEQRSKLRVLTRTPGVPTHLIAIRSDLPMVLRVKMKEALLRLSKENPELLSDVYGAAKFVEVDEQRHIASAVKALSNTGLQERELVK